MDLASNLIGIGVSSLLSLITFLFAAWIKSQVKERILELELRFATDYVRTESLDKHLDELKTLIMSLQRQVGSLQRLIDRRFGSREDDEAHE